MRVAFVAPPWQEVPPVGYGGIESVCYDLTQGLVARGHDVTLIAAGGKHVNAGFVGEREERWLLDSAGALSMPVRWNEPFELVAAEASACARETGPDRSRCLSPRCRARFGVDRMVERYEAVSAMAVGRVGEQDARDGVVNERGCTMKARTGDRIVIQGHRIGEPERDGEILEVHGADGDPPFLVRWSADGHEALLFPGPDAVIVHREDVQPTTRTVDT